MDQIIPGVIDEQRSADLIRDMTGTRLGTAPATLEQRVVALLVCPVDRNSLRLDENELVCKRCGREYPALSGIPRMALDEAMIEQKF